MDGWTVRQMDRQTGGQTYIQTKGQTDIWTGGYREHLEREGSL